MTSTPYHSSVAGVTLERYLRSRMNCSNFYFTFPPKQVRKSGGNIRKLLIGRGERIRTSDPLRPRQVRYQAALRPVKKTSDHSTLELLEIKFVSRFRVGRAI